MHKNLAKVAASAQGGASTAMPLQPSSSVNLIRPSSADDKAGGSTAAQMMGKLQSIRNIYTGAGTSSGDAAPAPSGEEPSQALTKSASSLSSSSLSASVGASNSGSASAEADGETPDVRASQSVLSLQERLARLRA